MKTEESKEIESGLTEKSKEPKEEEKSREGRESGWNFTIFLGISIIFILGIFVRLYGIQFGFPGFFRPDEEYYVYTIFQMDTGDLNPHFFYYPSFYFYLNLVIWRAYVLLKLFIHQFDPNSSFGTFAQQNTQTMYLIGRYVGAILGSLTILITYLIGRRFYGVLAGVLAALFLAFNPVHSLNSHFFKSDIATAFFMTLSLYFMVKYLEEGIKRNLYLSAGIAGTAFSTNYYGGFLMIPLIMTLLLRTIKEKREQNKKFLNLFISAEFYLTPLILILVFALLSPYVFIDFHSFLKHFQRMLFADRVNLYNTFVQLKYTENFFQYPLLYSLEFCLRHTMGIALSILSMLGVLFLLVRFSMKNFVILTFLLSFFFLIATGKAVFTRYYAPIAPVLSLICAVTLSAMYNRLLKRNRLLKIILFSVFLVLLVIEPLYVTFKQSIILSREDTRVTAMNWMKKNLPPSATIATLLDYRYGKPTTFAGIRYIKLLPTIEATFRSGAQYILIDTYALNLYSPDVNPGIKKEIEQKSEHLTTFTYSEEPQKEKPVVDVLDAFYLPVHRFGKIQRPGPEIQIYRIIPEKLFTQITSPAKKAVAKNGENNGLKAKYFTNTNCEGVPIERVDSEINFDWNEKAPMPSFPRYGYSAIWEGWLRIPVDANYTFYLTSDDGSRLWIDEEMIISNWRVQSPTEVQATRHLNEGLHSIKVSYYQENYGASVQLSWSHNSEQKSIISKDYFRVSME